MLKQDTTTIYFTPNLPRHWIVIRDGEGWIIPAIANGWDRRQPYVVTPVKLKYLERASEWAHIGLGIPKP